LLDSSDRSTYGPALNQNAASRHGLPIVVGASGASTMCTRLNIAHSATAAPASRSTRRSNRVARRRWCAWRRRHRRTLDQLVVERWPYLRRPAAAGILQTIPTAGLWNLWTRFLDSNPTIRACLDRLRAARKVPEQPDFGLEVAARAISRRSKMREKDTWYLPTAARERSSPRRNPEGGVTYLFDDVTESLDLHGD